jgi:hypothetical protein
MLLESLEKPSNTAFLFCAILVRLAMGQILTPGISSPIFTGLPRWYYECLGMKKLISGMLECWYAFISYESALELKYYDE